MKKLKKQKRSKMDRIRAIVDDMNRILKEQKSKLRENLIREYGHKYKEVERLYDYDQQTKNSEDNFNLKKQNSQSKIGLGD